MRYSKLFGKTVKEAPRDALCESHKLLYRAGFIRESTAGRYYLLPLGMRVQQKIAKIIKEEMDKAGAQEMVTPVLHPLVLWKETNRTKTAGFELTKVCDRNKKEFVLGGTAEEMFVDLIRRMKLSYRELPLNLYQFSMKFRDELRPRGGLLRVREFVMKDAYSFDRGEREFKKTYQKMRQTYEIIFRRMGLSTLIIEADNGYIGGEYCHEFVVENPVGESHFLFCKNCRFGAHLEVVKNLQEGDNCPKCKKGILEKSRGIEAGNIFQLGYHYTHLMKGATFTDEDGRTKPYYMGCYGIGLGRTMAAVVEVHHGQNGIIWPKEIAPYQVHLVNLRNNLLEGTTLGKVVPLSADEFYEKLEKAGIEVLYDEREDVSAGEKLVTADLIGIPTRLVISEKTKGRVEWKERNKEKVELISVEEAIKRIPN